MEYYNIINEIHKTLETSKSLKNTLLSGLTILQNYKIIQAGTILLRSEYRNIFSVTASLGNVQPNSGMTIKPGEGIAGLVGQTGQPVKIHRISQDPAFVPEFCLFDSKDGDKTGYIVLPLFVENHIEGLICAKTPAVSQSDFSEINKILSLAASALSVLIKFLLTLKLERERFVEENVTLKQKLQKEFSFHNLIGNSHEMRDIYEQVAQVARSRTTVLLRGESGTGKELIAEAIHYNSLVQSKPFVRVNCAAIPETLIESEFFGYEKGAFTGAAAQKKGRFEMADQGTIFLDEIGELSPLTQVKLLRFLQDQSFERVGSTKTLRINTRVIAATNANLEKMMKKGLFREDLYYRLNVFSIFLPPLRDRRTDILLLADHFMLKYGRQHGKMIKRLSTAAIDSLMIYHWPGNVRELENCIERAVLVCDDQVIHSYHLTPSLQTAESSGTISHRTLEKAVTAYEKDLIQDALKSSRGNIARSARLLDTTERIIGYKIRRLGIQIERFKP